MAEQTSESPPRRRFCFQQGAIAISAAVILGIAAVLASWSAYRGGQTKDWALEGWSEYSSYTTKVNNWFQTSLQEREFEKALWREWLITTTSERVEAGAYLLRAMPPEVYNVVSWWADNESEYPTPFTPDNPFFEELPSEKLADRADRLALQADEYREFAFRGSAIGSQFGLANVFFAIVLFLAGFATLVPRRSVQIAFLALAVVGLAGGIWILADTPSGFSLDPQYPPWFGQKW